ncbi:hypothetical protein F5X99DRAFT_212813 [Biscogniauxia marginata]|nr:hypothetical protein F5X99DRAFT_212813 [Biscogniauxia marginata]
MSPHVRAMYEKMKWTGVEDKDGTKSFELPGQKSPNRDQRRRLKLIERQYHEIRARLKIPEGAKENEKEDEVLEELRSWTNALDEKTVLRTSRMAEKLAEKARSAMKTREMAGKRMSSELGLEPYKPRRRDIRELLAMEHKAKRLTKKARTLLSKLPGDVARNYERDLNEAEKGMRLAVELADKARELSDKAQEQVSDKSE